MNPTDEPIAQVEQDHRFPSGAWKGFFLQPVLPGKNWMELNLTFRDGKLTGDGRDRVGEFLFRGRYELESGKCWWTKQYVGRHSIAYEGYNEGKGIWGVWTMPEVRTWRGGFRIWPVAMGDPTGETLKEQVEVPISVDVDTIEVADPLAV
ncbi:MAG: hypothetical protein P4L84_36725 [Isosphaeraceae bacterium]|nr:hypothetical protein [Isosphaeraceae bacterium]